MATLLGWYVALVSVVSWLLLGCADCNSDYVTPSYRIIVVNAATGAGVCDAQVSVASQQATRSVNCSYAAPIPNGQQTTIEVTHDGFAPASKGVPTNFETDECDHAIESRVTIELTPI
jgi:hypothetical protein